MMNFTRLLSLNKAYAKDYICFINYKYFAQLVFEEALEVGTTRGVKCGVFNRGTYSIRVFPDYRLDFVEPSKVVGYIPALLFLYSGLLDELGTRPNVVSVTFDNVGCEEYSSVCSKDDKVLDKCKDFFLSIDFKPEGLIGLGAKLIQELTKNNHQYYVSSCKKGVFRTQLKRDRPVNLYVPEYTSIYGCWNGPLYNISDTSFEVFPDKLTFIFKTYDLLSLSVKTETFEEPRKDTK